MEFGTVNTLISRNVDAIQWMARGPREGGGWTGLLTACFVLGDVNPEALNECHAEAVIRDSIGDEKVIRKRFVPTIHCSPLTFLVQVSFPLLSSPLNQVHILLYNVVY